MKKIIFLLLILGLLFGCASNNGNQQPGTVPGDQVTDTTFPNRTDQTYPEDTDQKLTIEEGKNEQSNRRGQ